MEGNNHFCSAKCSHLPFNKCRCSFFCCSTFISQPEPQKQHDATKKTSHPPPKAVKNVGLVNSPSLQGLVRWEPGDLDKWTRWNLWDGGKQGFASGNKRVATLRHAFFSIRMYIIFGGQGFLVDFFRGKKGSFLGGYTPLKKKTNAGSPEH